MSFEDRLRQSVDSAVAGMRNQVENDLRALLQELNKHTAEAQSHAVNEARRLAAAQAAQETAAAVAAAEARARTNIEQELANARADERAQAALDVRRLVEAEIDQRYRDNFAAAEKRHALALADAKARAADEIRQSVAAARVREREAEMAAVTRLLDSIRGLDGAASLSEVLDALAQAASREAARSAVMVLKGDRVVGWKLTGFGPRDSQPKLIDLALNAAGVIGHAVGAARPVTTKDGQTAADGPGFTTIPPDRMGLAVPVIVGGRVVAVVYADSVGHAEREHNVPSGWPEVLEVLARHAARCLEALTAQRASASTPRFWVPPGGKATAAAPPSSNAGTASPGAGA